MIKLVDYQTWKAFPAEMRMPERIALAYAYDRQKKKFMERMKRAYIWADLDQVDDGKLDFLAVENRVLFYNTAMTPDVKRSLIRNSIYWYMKLGTRQATEEIINIICKNEHTAIEEWHLYGGKPFHFRVKIRTNYNGIKINIDDLLQNIIRYKRAIVRLDSVSMEKSQETKIHIASIKQIFVKLKIGINPYYKYINRNTKVQVGFTSLKYIRIYYNKKQEV